MHPSRRNSSPLLGGGTKYSVIFGSWSCQTAVDTPAVSNRIADLRKERGTAGSLLIELAKIHNVTPNDLLGIETDRRVTLTTLL